MNRQGVAFMLAAEMALSSLFPGAGLALDTGKAADDTAAIIHVTDFGADPGGGRDSAEAIIRALDQAAAVRREQPDTPIVVDFPKGEYQIYPDKAEKRELYMSNTSGENAQVKDRTIGILVEDTDDLTIEDNRFFRVNPDVDLQLSVANTTLAVGEATTASVETSGSQATYNRVYVLNACKNVVMKDNTYDYGMNIQTTADNMDRSELHIMNDDVKIFSSSLRAPVAPVAYKSSDPAVATVDDKGVITAKKAGVAIITAYSVMNGRQYLSNAQTIRVGGSTVQPELQPDSDSANSRLSKITCDGVDFGILGKYTYYYAALAEDTDAVDFTFEPEPGATLYTLLNGQRMTETAENQFHMELKDGFNIIETFVTAADGETRTVYRFAVLHSTSKPVQVNDLQVNGATLEDFDPDVTEYTCFVDSLDRVSVSIDTDGAPAIAANGVRTDIELRELVTDVTVSAHSSNGMPSKYYLLHIRKPDGENAALAEAQTGGYVTLDQAFDPGVTGYTGRVLAEDVSFRFAAAEQAATIALSYGGNTYTGKGTLTQALHFYKGENRITLRVTSPNGQAQRAYTFSLIAPEVLYLSELAYDPEKSYCGNSRENAIQYDHSTGNKEASDPMAIPGTITLRREDGTSQAFERGIGTHATSNVVFGIGGLALDTFSTYFGTDQEIKDLHSGGITFSFYANGEEWDYEGRGVEMNGMTPMKQIVASVKGVSELRLYADQGATAAHDHASYGDAKFTTTFLERPDKGDKAALRQTYDKAVRLSEDGSLDGMKPSTVAALQAAMAQAKAVLDYENATQAEIDASEQELKAAREALKPIVYGDVDDSGDITVVDALMVLQKAADKITLTDDQTVSADVDGNEGVTATDALYVLKRATGGIAAFPADA